MNRLQTLTKRSDIAQEFTWDLESIYPTNDDWENSFKKLEQSLPELEKLKETLAQSGQALLKVLQMRDELFEELEALFVYASMRKDEDTTNSMYLGMFDRAMQLYVHASTVISYIEPEILALPQATLETYMRETPGLGLYRQQCDEINRKR